MKLPETFYNGPEIVTRGSRNFIDIEFFTKDIFELDTFLMRVTDRLMPVDRDERTKSEKYIDTIIAEELKRYNVEEIPLKQYYDGLRDTKNIYSELVKSAGDLVAIGSQDVKNHVTKGNMRARNYPVIKVPNDVILMNLDNTYNLIINSRQTTKLLGALQIEVSSSEVKYSIGRNFSFRVFPKETFPRTTPEYYAASVRVSNIAKYLVDNKLKEQNSSVGMQDLSSVVNDFQSWMGENNYKKNSAVTFLKQMDADLTFDSVCDLSIYTIKH